MLQRLCEVWGGGQRGEAFLGCSLKAEKRGEGRPASTDVPDRRRGASLHRDAAARPRLREPQTSPLSAPRAVHGGRGWVQRRAEGLRAQCSPGAAIRADTGRAPPCGPTAAPELSRRLHNSGGWGGRGAEGGAARGQRMDTDTWTREHGHTDTGTRTRGSTQPSGPCRAHSCAAGLRPRDSTRGLDGGGWGGGTAEGPPPPPPPPDPSADSERELRCPSPPRGPPRSRAAAVTFPQGHGAARGSPGGGPGSGLQPAPRLAHLALHRLLRGTCGEAGGGGGAGVRAGRSGAERAPRGAAPPDPHPPLRTCAALRGQLAGAARQRVHRAAPPAPHGTAPPLPPAECTPCPAPGL